MTNDPPDTITAAMETELGNLDDLDPDTATEVADGLRNVATLGGTGTVAELAAAEILDAHTRHRRG